MAENGVMMGRARGEDYAGDGGGGKKGSSGRVRRKETRKLIA